MFKGVAKRPLVTTTDELAAGKTLKLYAGHSISGSFFADRLAHYPVPPVTLALVSSSSGCDADLCVDGLVDSAGGSEEEESNAIARFAVTSAALLAFLCF